MTTMREGLNTIVLKYLSYRRCDDEYYISKEKLAALRGELLAYDVRAEAMPLPVVDELKPRIRDIIYAINVEGKTSAARADAIIELFKPYLHPTLSPEAVIKELGNAAYEEQGAGKTVILLQQAISIIRRLAKMGE